MKGKLLSLVAALALSAGCTSDDPKAAGEECVSTSECAEGLTCDLGQTPSICTDMQTTRPDAGNVPTIDAAPRPDADPNAPDARPVPDATPGAPDAMVDAAAPDANIPDSAPLTD